MTDGLGWADPALTCLQSWSLVSGVLRGGCRQTGFLEARSRHPLAGPPGGGWCVKGAARWRSTQSRLQGGKAQPGGDWAAQYSWSVGQSGVETAS